MSRIFEIPIFYILVENIFFRSACTSLVKGILRFRFEGRKAHLCKDKAAKFLIK